MKKIFLTVIILERSRYKGEPPRSIQDIKNVKKRRKDGLSGKAEYL